MTSHNKAWTVKKVFANTVWPKTEWRRQRDRLVNLWHSRSRLLSDSGRENARLDSVGPPFTLSRRDRTLFCLFLAKRARRIFHIAASLRLATLVRTAVMAVERKKKHTKWTQSDAKSLWNYGGQVRELLKRTQLQPTRGERELLVAVQV